MKQHQNVSHFFFGRSLFYKTMLGTGIAFLLILGFIYGEETQSEWPEMWQIKPFIITPLIGAFGGALFHIFSYFLPKTGIPKIITYILSILCFVVILWLGIVLGLDGTLWD